MSSVLFAVRSKGVAKYVERGQAIVKNYGPTPFKMARALSQFNRTLEQYGCTATFPVTASVVENHGAAIKGCLGPGIELAIHGYQHIDHSQLDLDQILSHLLLARRAFEEAGIPASGFRSPYLSFNESVRLAVEKAGLDYLSDQPILWDVIPTEPMSPAARTAYQRAIDFYNPWLATEQPSLPRLRGGLVEIPVSLPDDEIMIDRLGGDEALVEQAWTQILLQSHSREELFTLMLHPERIGPCAGAMSKVLARAREIDPPVWIARLDQISAWWRARSKTEVSTQETEQGELMVHWTGPEDVAMLVRNVEVKGPSEPWAHGYRRCACRPVTLSASVRPFIGVPINAPEEWAGYLRELGYIVEASDDAGSYSTYLDHRETVHESMRSVIDRIEQSGRPLARLARWPGRAASALAITGDVDALTLWDYGMRFLSR